MVGFIDTLEQAVLDHVLNDGAYVPPANWFVGVSTTTPTDAGGNFTEPVGNGYGRVSTAAADWAAATGTAPATKSNGTIISFPMATGAWGTITHFGLFIAGAGGTVQIFGPLTVTKSPTNLDTPSFGIGSLIIQLGDPADSY